MTARYHTSRPDQWTSPRPTRDPMGNKYAPLQPMSLEQRGWLARLIGGKRNG